jgi:uncharacterized protein YecE (DUF72 family)
MPHPNRIHIGTSGYTYTHWKGPFYPEKLRDDELLEFYSEQFHTVEINNSFYRVPSRETIRKWRTTTPGSFIFSVKASRYITHMKKLKDPEEPVATFLDNVRELKGALGAVLFQLPPRWKCSPERLSSFMKVLPACHRYAFEFRDPSWHNEEIYDILRAHGAAFCVYELAGFLSPRTMTAEFAYVRLHGPGKEKYQGSYDRKALLAWKSAFLKWSDELKGVYCYFDNDEKGYAARNALELQEMVQKDT